MSDWTAVRPVRGTRAPRVLFAVLAIGQLVAIGASAAVGASFTQTGADDPAIVPFAPAFSIWGVIVGLTVAFSIWQAVTPVDPAGTTAIARPMLVTAGGFSLWLAAASLSGAEVATVPIFAAMGVGLFFAARAARAADLDAWPRWARGLLWGMLGTYGGWTAVALWVNLATLLAGAGAPVTGTWGTTWQLLLAAGAAGGAVVLTVLSRRVSPALTLVFGLTTSYALGFAAVGAAERGATLIAIVAGVLAAALVVTALVVAARGHRSQTER